MLHHHYTPWSVTTRRWMIIGLGWFVLSLVLWGSVFVGHVLGLLATRPIWVSLSEFGSAVFATFCWIIGQWIHDHPSLK